MSDKRCVEGRLYRHDPQFDDPYLETDVGECPDCSGDGFGDEPVSYEQLQRAYEDMRDLCRKSQDGWKAERRKLWATEAAVAEAIRWLDADGNTGTGYINRIWAAKNALGRAQS
jgi:hypothetical protein